MKNFSSLISWFILICVLAIPAFLFYNWLASKNINHENQAPQMKSNMDTSQLFKKENPNLKQSATTPKDNISGLQVDPSNSASSHQGELQTTNTSQDMTGSIGTSTYTAEVPGTKNEGMGKISENETVIKSKEVSDEKKEEVKRNILPSTFSAVVSTMSYYAPTSKRDPTLTPMDYERMREEEERMKRAIMEKLKEEKRKKIENSPVRKLNLQGIVGKSAIINGEMVNEGQIFKGFKVLKIGYDYVIVVYKKDNTKYTLKMK